MKYRFSLFIIIVFFSQTLAVDVLGREVIGKVLKKPIYRDQLSSSKGDDLSTELYTLFAQPVLDQYLEKYKEEMEPSSTEIAQFVAYYKEKHEEELKDRKQLILGKIAKIMTQLKNKELPKSEKEVLIGEVFYLKSELDPPGLEYANFVLPHWKMQKHFYNNYGGGRLLYQPHGIEAFDAFHKWLKEKEKKGYFSIKDKKLRALFYHHWTTKDHGNFIIEDKYRIKKEFLRPEWLGLVIRSKKGCFSLNKTVTTPECEVYKKEYN